MRSVPLLLCMVVLLGATSSRAAPTRPIVLVPGILGSQLCEGDTRLWGGVDSLKNLESLEIYAGNTRVIRPCGIIKNVQILGPLIESRYYIGLLKTLEDAGYEEKRNLFIFDYDWRQSNADSSKRLAEYINKTLPDGSFDIVAHSMGGLVTRLYVANPENAKRVSRVVYLGTPFLGSGAALGTLSEGWGWIGNRMAGGMDTIRRVVLTWPGFLELLPRYNECCRLRLQDDTYKNVDPYEADTWVKYRWLPSELTTGPRFEDFRTALSRAAGLYGVFSSPTPDGIAETLFAGNAHLTFYRMGMREAKTNPSQENWKFRLEPGDGTVPMWSAARDVAQSSTANALPSFNEHPRIFDDKWVQAELSYLLTTTSPGKKEPISSRGRPTISAGANGREFAWIVNSAEIRASSPTVRAGDKIEVTITIDVDKSARIDRGLYLPKVRAVSSKGVSRDVVVKETTTDQDILDRQLHFQADLTAGALEELVEIYADMTESYSASTGVLVLE